jgi:hypothetical protein
MNDKFYFLILLNWGNVLYSNKINLRKILVRYWTILLERIIPTKNPFKRWKNYRWKCSPLPPQPPPPTQRNDTFRVRKYRLFLYKLSYRENFTNLSAPFYNSYTVQILKVMNYIFMCKYKKSVEYSDVFLIVLRAQYLEKKAGAHCKKVLFRPTIKSQC